MKRMLSPLIVALILLSTTPSVYATPSPPTISYTTNGLDLTVNWTKVPDATGYLLSYAPFPYQGDDTIGSLDMQEATEFPITLWDGASYYIAVQAYDDQGISPYSNIDLFTITLETEFVSGATYGDLLLIGEDVSFTVFTSQEADIEIGAINVPFLRSSSTYRFVNILVDLNANGAFEPYLVFSDTQEEWVVKNVPLGAVATSNGFLLDLIDPSVVPETSLDIRVVVTNGPLDEAQTWNGYIPDGAVGRDMTVAANGQEWIVSSTPDETSIGGGGGHAAQAPTLRTLGDTTAVDVSPVNGTLYRAGMPDGNQGLNQCVAQSVANSLSWLSRRYSFTDKLDDAYDADDYPAEDRDHSTTEGASILGSLVNDAYMALGLYNPAIGVVGTPGATSFAEALPGLKTNILKGKDKFVADNNLPVESSIITVGAGSNLFTEIKKAMESDECAVEVVLEILDENNNTIGGHAVSVSGFADLPLGSSNYRGITFHDGNSENITDNGPGNDTYPLNGETIDKFPFLGPDNKIKLRTAKLSFAIKQCYKPVEVGCWGDYFGQHNFMVAAIDDSANHGPRIGDPFANPLSISGGANSQVSVSGPAPFIDVTGISAGTNGSCQLSATGLGNAAGFPNVSATLNLNSSGGTVFGTYQIGSNGELFGVPITYTIQSQ